MEIPPAKGEESDVRHSKKRSVGEQRPQKGTVAPRSGGDDGIENGTWKSDRIQNTVGTHHCSRKRQQGRDGCRGASADSVGTHANADKEKTGDDKRVQRVFEPRHG